ncbi:glycine betaine ABC transporter substrate-binding protein [Sediminibacillus massiliensis]|uniref:glycine betaine ABC transporter substrate-binding protein n=1 Tax=Sediminibacillus massiliensis TaxID=1926277 RepID=UPI0009889177|nr:glycine betaine ABC transporter substrate-binding protein [Sediminibacillus massiliensis]
MKKIIFSLVMILVLGIISACGADSQGEEASTNSDEGKPTITFGVAPWTTTVPPTKVAGLILEDMGYTVEETKADVGGVFTGLSRGDLDVFMDSWMPMHENYFEKYSDSIEDTAVSYPEAETGWVVPTYMEDINSISDIGGNEDIFDNKYYGIEEGASATKTSKELIKAYGLDMEHVASSEGGMLAQASRLMKQEEPVVFFGWRPHTMFNKYDLKVLEDDKGFFETSSVHVVTNNNLKDKAPEAYEFLSNWSIPIDDVEEMIVKIEEGADETEVAQEWIDNNQEKVNKMIGE